METATSTLSVLPSTKEQVENFSMMLIEELNGGHTNPLDIVNFRKCMEKVFEKIKPTLDKLAVEEAQKYGKEFSYKGMKITVKEMGTKFDFSNTGDPYYAKYQVDLGQLNEKLKERETFLKNLKNSMTVVDEDTGETITLYPPIKKSTTGIQVELIDANA